MNENIEKSHISIKEQINIHGNDYLQDLFEIIRIPSVSAKSEHKIFMLEAANALRSILIKAGADKVEILQTAGNPVVFGEKIIDKNYPTIMVYGHYDVQPPEPLELWNTPPFEPTIINEHIYARGADDDKGQLFMHIKAFEILNKLNFLSCNVKFLIEGEEEIGSPNLRDFCINNVNKLSCNVIIVSDTNMIDTDIPSITVGLRGLSYLQLEVTGANRDLHSGIFGGAVANPIIALSQIISQLIDENNHITIPGFYDDAIKISNEERIELNKAPFDLDSYCKSLDIKEVTGEKGYTTVERTGIRPSMDINGIWGGYTGEGAKTVLPSKAYAKLSFRLVPNQEPKKIAQLFQKYIASITPNGVSIAIEYLHGGKSYFTSTESKEYKAAEKAYSLTYDKKPFPVRTGGSIPVIADFEEILNVKSLLLGFGLESDAIHSPNENYPLKHFFKGIETICMFYILYQEYYK